MATSKISLSELKPGSCSRTVVLRFSVFGSYKCEERSNNDFKLLYSIVAIRLHEFTKLVKVHAVANPIPTEMFIFRKLEQVMALANTNVELQTSRFGCIVASDAAMSKVTNVRAVEVPHPMNENLREMVETNLIKPPREKPHIVNGPNN
ncbi:hypothetical protein Bca4012_100016 [Brassica carinata]